MCDQDTQQDVDEFLRRSGLTRRKFGTLAGSAGLGMMLPRVLNAQSVTETDLEITTPDGVADCYFVHPSAGRHPAVLVWPDILGLRPAFRSDAPASSPPAGRARAGSAPPERRDPHRRAC